MSNFLVTLEGKLAEVPQIEYKVLDEAEKILASLESKADVVRNWIEQEKQRIASQGDQAANPPAAPAAENPPAAPAPPEAPAAPNPPAPQPPAPEAPPADPNAGQPAPADPNSVQLN